MDNIYRPYLMTITEIIQETYDTQTLRFEFQDANLNQAFDFKPGQFGEFSVFGTGESPFCIASPPTRKGYIECCFRKIGLVTKALTDLEVDDIIGFRGPYGNGFPMEQFKGKNILLVSGGMGLAPLRSVIWYCIDRRKDFGEITIVYGARTVADLIYKRELKEWEARKDIKLIKTVDPGGETKDWDGKVGLVPMVLEKSYSGKPKEQTVALVCGPPIMIKFTFPVLDKLGFKPDNIYTTLENRMKCGLGKCGRCNVGKVYICKEGPVFTAAQLKNLPTEY